MGYEVGSARTRQGRLCRSCRTQPSRPTNIWKRPANKVLVRSDWAESNVQDRGNTLHQIKRVALREHTPPNQICLTSNANLKYLRCTSLRILCACEWICVRVNADSRRALQSRDACLSTNAATQARPSLQEHVEHITKALTSLYSVLLCTMSDHIFHSGLVD